jgi:TolA-binding protein
MRFTWQARLRSGCAAFGALALAGGLVVAAAPASAQDRQDSRIRKLESEVKALQRKVFPGPDGTYFEPEVVTPPAGGVSQGPSLPIATTTPLTDVLQRLDSIEAQLSQLTARSEVTENALSKLEARVDALEKAGAAAAAPLPPGDATIDQPTGAIPVPASDSPPAQSRPPAKTTPASATKPAARPSAARLAKVQAVAKPDTGNPGDDEYSYGFRLWEAGLYPEAQQQLKLYVDKYPRDPEISYGRNLLGRAYLDNGDPRAAAPYFLDNYQKDPNGARAPDSLLFLAESMMALKDNTRACRALAEFGDKYASLANGRLQDQYAKDRQQAGCK